MQIFNLMKQRVFPPQPEIYENLIFPFESHVVPRTCVFKNCLFQKGVTLVDSSHHDTIGFHSCLFQEGAIVRFTNPVRKIAFSHCVFESGSLVDWGEKGCSVAGITNCMFPETVSVFASFVKEHMIIIRSNPETFFPFYPRCNHIYLFDDSSEPKEKMFSMPRDALLFYSSSVEMSSPRSLDVLISMTMRYPSFVVSELAWCGDKEELDKFYRLHKHSRRHLMFVILSLLHVLPAELVRGVLVDFLV